VGRIPVKLVVILVLGAVVTLYAIVRSLFVRIRDDEDPGRAISEAEAPGLWKTAREVAAAVGTRSIDEIWLTPGTDLAVLERGTVRQRMTDRGRRALLLGAGTLEGFHQDAFRAVLAHEYGHFSHRDTAGGDVALRVRHGMMAFAVALAKAGFAVWWNLAFQFLRLYDLLFRRISHGATRLQEVLADRIAIQHYGIEAFSNGLTHVIRRSLLFQKVANDEIQKALEQERLLSNLYSLAAPSDTVAVNSLEEEVTKILDAKTTEDDTHPSPRDRFRLGQRIHSAAVDRTDGYVWQLFSNPDALMAEMTSLVAQRIGVNAVGEAAAQ
jgi:Zn-dependent protease with chaperone function